MLLSFFSVVYILLRRFRRAGTGFSGNGSSTGESAPQYCMRYRRNTYSGGISRANYRRILRSTEKPGNTRNGMFTNEAAIMKECAEGLPGNFIRIYERYFRKIYDFAYYRTCCRESAEDITSQTFMRALEKADTYDSSRASVVTWLFRIASNLLADHFRKTGKNGSAETLETLASDEDFESRILDRELLTQVMTYFEKLPQKKKEIVVLRIWQNLPYKDIAGICGMSEASCKMSFYRTIEEIREKFPLHEVLGIILCIVAIAIGGTEAGL